MVCNNIFFFILLLGLDVAISQKYISVTRYVCENLKLDEEFRIVHLTDLHNYQFGVQNQRLVKKIEQEKPDVIFLTGDMLNANAFR